MIEVEKHGYLVEYKTEDSSFDHQFGRKKETSIVICKIILDGKDITELATKKRFNEALKIAERHYEDLSS